MTASATEGNATNEDEYDKVPVEPTVTTWNDAKQNTTYRQQHAKRFVNEPGERSESDHVPKRFQVHTQTYK